MLIKFKVGNFKSIGSPVELSMLPVNESINEKFVQTINTRGDELKVLQRCGIFGPNASGKTALIQALMFARNYIVEGQKSGQPTRVNQFRGDLKTDEGISKFVFVFYWRNEVYEYGFSLDSDRVRTEHLSRLLKSGFCSLFTRETDEKGKTKFNISRILSLRKKDDWNLINVLSSSIKENQKNQLFLYKLYDNGIKQAQLVVEWFENLTIILPNSIFELLPVFMKEYSNFGRFAGKILNDLDTGVVEVSTKSFEYDFDEFAEKYSFSKKLLDKLKKEEKGALVSRNKFIVLSQNGNRITADEVKLTHSLTGKEIPLGMEDESDGTLRLLDLMPILFTMALPSRSVVFCIDELDRSLHTKLSQFILDCFLLNNKSRSQIIFTAHDVNLINLERFDQNEIWFIEKDNSGQSRLVPLSDYTIAKDQNVLNDYLNGRFGAIPLIKKRCL